ncbi:hypothetical protein [Brevibacillus migulae]|uniref:hypothetical protein n=1 Tax=Brevibacillus migulae TaxID=1644114 RepID=UPI00106E4DFB|nr:hypothetical protein [Brevibacillus migulae]
MKRTNMMKTALLSTVALANIFACASAFAAEETTTAAPAATETTATETAAPATETKTETTVAAPVAAPVAGTTFRIDEGTYVEIRDVYGNPVVVQVQAAAPAVTQTSSIDIFGGSVHTVNSVRNDNRN